MRIAISFLWLFVVGLVYAEGMQDYLISADIGEYLFRPKRAIEIYGNSGVLIGAEHFYMDHDDITYQSTYIHPKTLVGVDVQITQHAGAESDKWLYHELDLEFRNYYGIPGKSYGPMLIDGQTILEDSVAGANYRWLSGNKVIVIEYHDAEMTKPEPIEVVRAYLAKHPSTLPQMSLMELRSSANKTKWIKDEMERRLWLGEKWFLQLQMGKVEVVEALDRIVKTLAVFLNYRERYYGIKARDEKIALLGYQELKDGTAIKAKLSEYKTWWAVNKTKSISVP